MLCWINYWTVVFPFELMLHICWMPIRLPRFVSFNLVTKLAASYMHFHMQWTKLTCWTAMQSVLSLWIFQKYLLPPPPTTSHTHTPKYMYHFHCDMSVCTNVLIVPGAKAELKTAHNVYCAVYVFICGHTYGQEAQSRTVHSLWYYLFPTLHWIVAHIWH